MTLRELAELMQRLGAQQALNLDGGGSSEMVVNGLTASRPSDGRPRTLPPRFGRFDYRQKFEYWGLIFGSLVMVATGFILYFPIAVAGVRAKCCNR